MFNLGAEKLLVIFFIALIIVGPDKLPDLARKAGKALADLRRMSGGFQEELRRALDEPMQTFTREFTGAQHSTPAEPAMSDGSGGDTPAEPALDTPDDELGTPDDGSATVDDELDTVDDELDTVEELDTGDDEVEESDAVDAAEPREDGTGAGSAAHDDGTHDEGTPRRGSGADHPELGRQVPAEAQHPGDALPDWVFGEPPSAGTPSFH